LFLCLFSWWRNLSNCFFCTLCYVSIKLNFLNKFFAEYTIFLSILYLWETKSIIRMRHFTVDIMLVHGISFFKCKIVWSNGLRWISRCNVPQILKYSHCKVPKVIVRVDISVSSFSCVERFSCLKFEEHIVLYTFTLYFYWNKYIVFRANTN